MTPSSLLISGTRASHQFDVRINLRSSMAGTPVRIWSRGICTALIIAEQLNESSARRAFEFEVE